MTDDSLTQYSAPSTTFVLCQTSGQTKNGSNSLQHFICIIILKLHHTVGPAMEYLTYLQGIITSLDIDNQSFPTLVKLRQHKPILYIDVSN